MAANSGKVPGDQERLQTSYDSAAAEIKGDVQQLAAVWVSSCRHIATPPKQTGPLHTTIDTCCQGLYSGTQSTNLHALNALIAKLNANVLSVVFYVTCRGMARGRLPRFAE